MKVQRVCVCLLPALLGQSKPLSAENMKVNAQYHTHTDTETRLQTTCWRLRNK